MDMLFHDPTLVFAWFGVLLVAAVAFAGGAGTHPLLVVRRRDFGLLRDKASRRPWREMKNSALRTTRAGYRDMSSDNFARVQDCLSASALAYIIDRRDNRHYVRLIVEGVTKQLGVLDLPKDRAKRRAWASVLYGAILALDVVHDAVEPDDLAECEANVEAGIDALGPMEHSKLDWYGLHIAWDIYRTGSSNHIDGYHDLLDGLVTADGVFKAGCELAQKWLGCDSYGLPGGTIVDVLEHTGLSEGPYSDDKARNLREWLYGYSITPFRTPVPLGWASPSAGPTIAREGGIFTAMRYSKDAARYAAWYLRGVQPKGRLLTYCLIEGKIGKPVRARSRIFTDGGAWLLEERPSADALMGVLWAPKSSVDQSYHDAGAVYIAAYGQHLLLNAGRPAQIADGDESSQPRIGDIAEANNVLLFSQPPQAKHTAGIVEGFTTGLLDYACSDLGPAAGQADHLRSLVLLHQQRRQAGYFILIDEAAMEPGSQVNIFLHPNTKASSAIDPVGEESHYVAPIDGYVMPGSNVSLTMGFGAEPKSIEHLDGIVSCGDEGSLATKYLKAEYSADRNGRLALITVLYPVEGRSTPPKMKRASGRGYSGMWVMSGENIVDCAVSSVTSDPVALEDGSSFVGKAAIFRTQHDGLIFYFARQATSFDDGRGQRTGFDSPQPLTVYLKGRRGTVISPGTKARFYCPGLTRCRIDEQAVEVADSGDGWINVNVPAGRHELKLIAPNPG